MSFVIRHYLVERVGYLQFFGEHYLHREQRTRHSVLCHICTALQSVFYIDRGTTGRVSSCSRFMRASMLPVNAEAVRRAGSRDALARNISLWETSCGLFPEEARSSGWQRRNKCRNSGLYKTVNADLRGVIVCARLHLVHNLISRRT